MSNIFDAKKKGGTSVFVIAEVSSNHNQDFDTAIKIIKAAKECGADAVKFQIYTPDSLTIDINNKYFRIRHPKWGGQTLYELYKKAFTPWDWFKQLKKAADDVGITFLCTAFDKKGIDFLEKLDICVHKIASFELVDLPLIEYTAKKGKPLIMSTGMADIDEIQQAVDTAKKSGAEKSILLKCVSSYPAKPEEMNLKTIPDMQERFNCPVGISDHSLEIGASIAAVTLGACIIEKHFTLSKQDNTPDSFFSMEPQELRELVKNIRIVEKALGEVHYGSTDEENENMVFRRSLFVVKDVKAGEKVSPENVRSIRPGYGLHPRYFRKITGQRFIKNLQRGTPLKWTHIETVDIK